MTYPFWDFSTWKIVALFSMAYLQDCSISSALAMEILQSCTKPSIGIQISLMWAHYQTLVWPFQVIIKWNPGSMVPLQINSVCYITYIPYPTPAPFLPYFLFSGTPAQNSDFFLPPRPAHPPTPLPPPPPPPMLSGLFHAISLTHNVNNQFDHDEHCGRAGVT